MEFSNIRPGLGYQYYSNEYYCLLALITYGASDEQCHMDPYGRHSRHNDNTTKFRVISVYLLLKERQALNLALCHIVSPVCDGWQQKQRRLTQADQSNRTMTSVSHRGEQRHTVVMPGMHAALRKTKKQHKHSSKYFAYTIKCKVVIGIGPKIQSTPGPKHDQINTALIAHHLEV